MTADGSTGANLRVLFNTIDQDRYAWLDSCADYRTDLDGLRTDAVIIGLAWPRLWKLMGIRP